MSTDKEIEATCNRARNVLRAKGYPRANVVISYTANDWRSAWHAMVDRDSSFRSGLLSAGFETADAAVVAVAATALDCPAAWSVETVGKTLGIIVDEPANDLLAAAE